MATTAKGIPYPALDGSSPDDVPGDLHALAVWLDDRPGVSAVTTAQRNALSGVDLWDGRVVLNTTTKQLERYSSAITAWGPAQWGVLGRAEVATEALWPGGGEFINTGVWLDTDIAVPFTAPLSGKVALAVRGAAQINGGNSDNAARLGYHITGPTEIVAADARSLTFSVVNMNGGVQRWPHVSWHFDVTGLTPGGAYVATLAAKGSGGWSLGQRQLVVEG